MVDNFWHAQCLVMLTPRLPLYIPLAYASFQYVGVASSLRMPNAGVLERCAFAGLASGIFYAAYDLVGARFLWWTWHTTDAATVIRWCGVPVGSTMWTLVHVFVFNYVLHNFVISKAGGAVKKLVHATGERQRDATNEPIPLLLVASLLVVSTAALTTPFMMVMMSPFQFHQLEISWESWSDLRITQVRIEKTNSPNFDESTYNVNKN